MPWQQVTIEREELFREVWSKPMTSLCRQFGISDVGLRKVCIKLNVPVPSPGHWSKVRAGKGAPKPPLPSSCQHTRHQLNRWMEPDAEATQPHTVGPTQEFLAELRRVTASAPVDLARWHGSVLDTRRALDEAQTADERGRLVCRGAGVHDVRVSESMRARAVELCEVLLCGFKAAGMDVEERSRLTERPRALVGQYWVVWRIVELTATAVSQGRAATKRNSAAPHRRPTLPCLRVDFQREGEDAIVVSVRDTAAKPLERHLGGVVARLMLSNAVARAKADDAESQRQARRAELRPRVVSYELRKHELAQLQAAEELAERHRRAALLRAYALAVKETSFEQRALREDERDQRVAWILRAADWLDPTLSVRWPDVDDAPLTPF